VLEEGGSLVGRGGEDMDRRYLQKALRRIKKELESAKYHQNKRLKRILKKIRKRIRGIREQSKNY